MTISTSLSQEEERESISAGHFPPNSKVTGVRCTAAADITIRPTLALPSIGSYHTLKKISSKVDL